MIPELSIIVPTLNEAPNIEELVRRLDDCLAGVDWEVVFVDDDSTDGTLDVLQSLARRDPRVRYLHRVGRAGLSSACLEGFGSSCAPYMAVMDADLQHDERLLPEMLASLRRNEADLVVGSRYTGDGGVGDWSALRARMSRLATDLARLVLRVPLTDPMSGFFMIKRELYQRCLHRVSGKGFKILLDLVTSVAGAVRVKELPFEFRQRHAGHSKLDTLVIYEYFLVIADKLIGRYIPVNFVIFSAVGCLGAVLHLAILGMLLKGSGVQFLYAQAAATVFAMTANFLLNNAFTYRAMRLKGMAVLSGLFLFYSVCAIGAFANIRTAEYLYELSVPWWGAGLIGAVIGAVWNYAVSSIVVWTRRADHKAESAKITAVEDQAAPPQQAQIAESAGR
ncbi:MAG: glycosyltransferase family 2 protein [Pseudomonadota bacterium]